MTASWIYLIAAIVFEVAGTTSMKLSDGFTKIVPSALIFICYGISFSFLTLALKKFDVSFAYVVCSGLGTTLIASVGIFWFRESMTIAKFVSMALIIVGVVGINSSK